MVNSPIVNESHKLGFKFNIYALILIFNQAIQYVEENKIKIFYNSTQSIRTALMLHKTYTHACKCFDP